MSMPAHARLSFWRRTRNLSQQQLADRADVSQSWIAALEKGIYPLREPLRSILARQLDIPTAVLADDTPEPVALHATMAALVTTWTEQETLV